MKQLVEQSSQLSTGITHQFKMIEQYCKGLASIVQEDGSVAAVHKGVVALEREVKQERSASQAIHSYILNEAS